MKPSDTAQPESSDRSGHDTVPQPDLDLAPSAVRVPGYEVLGEIGRGGMGVVFKARHLELQRLVALNMILAAEYASPAERERFRAEASAAARLRHPGVVGVYDVGEHEGRPFFTMEYVEGGSLEDRLRGTPLPARDAAALVQSLARTVQYAHEQGVVHRDLKPANILLQRQSATDHTEGTDEGKTLPLPSAPAVPSVVDCQPKVTDFGLAKRLDVEKAHTATGNVVGTPSYMAPEQAAGQSKEVGPAADIYSLGAVLYECLTGRPPFRAENPFETLLQVVQDEPVPPSRLRPGLPADLETICLKCLHKGPGQRYATAGALADDLGRFLAGEPVVARPAGPLERAWKWARRRPAVAALTAALVLLTVAAFTAVTAALVAAVDYQGQLEAAIRDLRSTQEQQAAAEADAREQARQATGARQESDRNSYFGNVALAHELWRGSDLAAARRALDVCPADLRRWEWDYLHRVCNSGRAAHPAPAGILLGAQMSPDGKSYLLAPFQAPTTVRDPADGRELFSVPGQNDNPQPRSAFSPDGRELAVLRKESLEVVDARTGRALRSYSAKAKGGQWLCVTFLPDGRLLAVAGPGFPRRTDKVVQVWDLKDERKVAEAPVVQNPPDGVFNFNYGLSPDGRWLACLSSDTGIRVGFAGAEMKPDPEWGQNRMYLTDLKTGKGRRWPTALGSTFTSLAFSPDVRRLAWGDGPTVQELVLDGDKEPRTLRGHQKDVEAVAYDSTGRLASGGADRQVKLWDFVSGEELFTLRGHEQDVVGLAFSPDGRRLLTACADPLGAGSSVLFWEAVSPPESRTLRAAPTPDGVSLCCGLSAGGSRCLLSSLESLGTSPQKFTVGVRDPDTGRELSRLRGEPGQLALLGSLSPDGKRVAYATQKDFRTRKIEVHVFDADTGAHRRSIDLGTAAVGGALTALGFSPDGKLLGAAWLTGEAKKQVAIRTWDAESGQPRAEGSGTPLPENTWVYPTGLTFGPGPSHLIALTVTTIRVRGKAMDFSGEIQLWDGETGKLSASHPFDHAVMCAAFDAAGRRVAVGGGPLDQGRVSVWDVSEGRELLTLRGHSRAVAGIAFHPDGNRLATAAGDRLVKLWDLAEGREALTLTGHNRGVTAVAFSTDGRRLTSATGATVMELVSAVGVPAEMRRPAEVRVWDSR